MDKVTCLCPTYGRFNDLRNSLTFFLHQTYDNKEMIILNDAPVPITCEFPDVRVVNKDERYETLGHKRQALLEMADSPYIAQWDDDDVYLPWHLESCMSEIDRGCMVKPEEAFYLRGRIGGRFDWKGTTRNWLEAMTVCDREQALALGGYTEDVSGQCIRLIKRFQRDSNYVEFTPRPAPTFVFRFADGHFHIQGGNKESHERFGEVNTDFGNEPLRPRKVTEYYEVLKENGPDYTSDVDTFHQLIDLWQESPIS